MDYTHWTTLSGWSMLSRKSFVHSVGEIEVYLVGEVYSVGRVGVHLVVGVHSMGKVEVY